MVDVVFVLLLFFMACAGQTQHEGMLASSLPSRPATSVLTPIVVDIDAAGKVSLGGLSVGGGGADHELAEFTQQVGAAFHAGQVTNPENPDPVVIRPQLDTPHERVIDVLNACKKAHVTRLGFQ